VFEQATVLQTCLSGATGTAKRGLLFQHSCFSPKSIPRELRHRAAVRKVIEFLNLQALRDKYIGAIALGVRRWVELGRALASEPKLFCCWTEAPRASPF